MSGLNVFEYGFSDERPMVTGMRMNVKANETMTDIAAMLILEETGFGAFSFPAARTLRAKSMLEAAAERGISQNTAIAYYMTELSAGKRILRELAAS